MTNYNERLDKMSKDSVLELLRILQLADNEKRKKSDFCGTSVKINWDYLIEAVEELPLV